MELKRASLIQNTPPSTPRNSMLLVPPQTVSSNSSQMFNLQEFLTRFDPEDTPGMIREMEESEVSQQHIRSRLRSSQQSVSQVSNRSRSSNSLHSAPSSSSISRDNPDHHSPVIANPAAMAPNLNNNNSNNNNNLDSQESAPAVSVSNHNVTGGSSTLVEGGNATDGTGPNSSTPNCPKAVSTAQDPVVQSHSVISWGDASSISLSSSSTGDVRFSQGVGSQNQPVPHDENSTWKQRSYSTSAAYSETRNGRDFPQSTSSEGLKKVGKSKSKGRSLFKRHFHRSSDDLLEETSVPRNVGKPPLVQRMFHKSAFDLSETTKRKPGGKKKVGFSESESHVSPAFSLSGLTDLRHRGEMQIPGQRKKTKNTKRKSLQPKSLLPSRSQESIQKDQESNSGSDELVSLTDMLSELDPMSLSQPAPAPLHLHPSSPRSPGQDSIWQEYGCV